MGGIPARRHVAVVPTSGGLAGRALTKSACPNASNGARLATADAPTTAMCTSRCVNGSVAGVSVRNSIIGFSFVGKTLPIPALGSTASIARDTFSVA